MYSAQDVARLAIAQTENMMRDMQNQFQPNFGGLSSILEIQTNRWAYAVHVPQAGHFTNCAKIIRTTYNNVHIGVDNIGTPAFEEALYRGKKVAEGILIKRVKGYKLESWARGDIY
jgi:hypothetical protein